MLAKGNRRTCSNTHCLAISIYRSVSVLKWFSKLKKATKKKKKVLKVLSDCHNKPNEAMKQPKNLRDAMGCLYLCPLLSVCPPRLSCTELLTRFFIHAIYFRLLEEEVSKALSSALTPKVHFFSKNNRLTTNIKPGYDRIKREQPCSANEQGAGVKTEKPRESRRWYTQVVRIFQSCGADPGYS